MTAEQIEPSGSMESWPNDDLVLQDETRKHLFEVFPRVAPIFDASDLHELFRKHEAPANLAKKNARKWGKVAIGLGMASIFVAAIMPVVLVLLPECENVLLRILGVLVCCLTLFGLSIGYWMALRGESRQAWMQHRLWTERLRQFHFQSIANNILVVSEAIATQDFESWRAARARDLDVFTKFRMKSTAGALVQVLEDEGEDEVWLSADWRLPPKPPSGSLDDELIILWREQRLGIQLRYTQLTLGAKGGGGKRRQTRMMQGVISGLTFGALASSFGLAVLCLVGQTGLPLAIAQALLSIFGGGSIAARAYEEGMIFGAESDRMEWYLAALQGIGGRLRYAQNAREQLELMRDLERLSYQEMHRFFATMNQAKFIM